MRLLAQLCERNARLCVSHPQHISHAAVLLDEIVTAGTAAKGDAKGDTQDQETYHSVGPFKH
jgi:hypothetical protein